MKKILDSEKFNLGDVLKRGLSVRDEIVNEFNLARSKFAKVNWQEELDSFKKNPLDAAQSYLNQVNEVLRSRSEHQATSEVTSTTKTPTSKPVAAKKPRATSAKSPRAKKSVAKKTAAKKPATKKSAAKKTTTQTTGVKQTATTRRSTGTKSKTTRTTAKAANTK